MTLSQYLSLLSIGFPFWAAVLLLFGLLRRPWVILLSSWSALPSLLLSLWAIADPSVTGHVDLPWLLVGIELGLDGLTTPFLLLTSVLWMVAGIYSHSYMKKNGGLPRFFVFFCASMAGNIGLVLSRDMVAFYLFFALMTFAGFGLVVHSGTALAHRAGRVYIVMAVMGESLVIAAMLLIASVGGDTGFRGIHEAVADSPFRNVMIGLVLTGFGIKAGVLPVHVWLPLAHPVAPTPASAVLSGAMIKAGLLAWLRFLPMGEISFPGWGILCLVIGLAGAFYAVAVGLTQDDPKTVLAYSSVSQMGIMMTGLGAGMMNAEAWPACLTALLIYSLHHGLVKGGLFLGVGIAGARGGAGAQWLIGVGLLLASLGLAGAPLTGGFVAKAALKSATAFAPGAWPDWLAWLLPLASVGTTLLMGRFLLLLLTRSTSAPVHGLTAGLWLPWAGLVLFAGIAPWILPFERPIDQTQLLSLAPLTTALWPILMGGTLVWGVWFFSGRRRIHLPIKIPPGDLLELLATLRNGYRVLGKQAQHISFSGRGKTFFFRLRDLAVNRNDIGNRLQRLEDGLSRWPAAVIIYLVLGAILLALLSFP